jgi:methyl-accepting chemotaxis protein
VRRKPAILAERTQFRLTRPSARSAEKEPAPGREWIFRIKITSKGADKRFSGCSDVSQWTISKKIAVALAVVLAQAIAVGGYAGWKSAQADSRLRLVTADYLPEIRQSASLERELLNARIHFIYFVTIQKPGALDKGWERFRSAKKELPRLLEVVDRSESLAAVRPAAQQLRGDMDAYEALLNQMVVLVQGGRTSGPEYMDLLNRWASLGATMVTTAGQLHEAGMSSTNQWADETAGDHKRTTVLVIAGCLAGVLLGALVSFTVTRGISRALRAVTGGLALTANQVAEASAQIANSARSLADGASSQAAALEQTSASSQEIGSVAVENARNSAAAAGNMAQTSQRIEEANATLNQMIESMHQINLSGDKISKIIRVIDEIAFQTNILALNAAVEAARAGEAGMGFAVVAEEVRNLAQRSAQAAKDTAALIEESISRSGDGKSKLNEMAEVIHAITTESAKVKAAVDQLSTASQEQERGLREIGKALEQVGTVTQRAAGTASESALASDQLRDQSSALKQSVEQLTAMVGGGATAGQDQ